MAIYIDNEEVQSEQVNQETQPAQEETTPVEIPEVPAEENVETPPAKSNTKYSEVLSKLSQVKEYNIQDDGVTFINIGNKVKTELGQLLSWTAGIKDLYTIYGKVGTIRNFSDAITIKNFPVEYMGLIKIPKDVLDKHVFSNTEKRLSIPNFWSLIAYVTAESIRSRKHLAELMKNNQLDYGCVTEKRKQTLFGTEIIIPSTIKQMVYYVGIVRGLDKIVKDGKLFDNAVVGKFIEDCRFAPDKAITDGVRLPTLDVKSK